MRVSRAIQLERMVEREIKFAQGLLWCGHCQSFKAIGAFYKVRSENSDSNFGYRFYCIECESRKKKGSSKAKGYYKARNTQFKRQFVDLAGGCCQRCGYSEFLAGLEFHHIDRGAKMTNPAMLINRNNFDRTCEELDKCCLLCRNCHTAYTAGEWQADFIKRDGLGWTIQYAK